MTEKRFIEQFEENVRLYPDKVILRDEHGSLTFRELDDLSGRVYAYLKAKGIGREDVVMIDLPRGKEVFVAQIGIWKSGAVMLCIENLLPEERKKYMQQDCHCEIVIDSQEWSKIKEHAPIHGHKNTDKHDAAFICYTSGSEGLPKGVVHEYGKLEITPRSNSIDGKPAFTEDDIYGACVPLSSLPIIGITTVAACNRTCAHVIPFEVVRNPEHLANYINENKISVIGLVPTYLREVKVQLPHLRQMQLAADVANGIYCDDYELLNVYGQTECGAISFTFRIDKCYDLTPIGKPTEWVHEALLDDNDTIVPEGQMGELCYENPYTRGYLNDPELTAKVFKNSLYHTGDIAKRLPDGNYVILGRKSDMIKINGNRIEPAEIEAAAKKVLGIDWAFAKGFVTEERSFICVYYTADIDINYAQVREELLKILPTYMIPSYFVHLDEVPHLPNGKVDRQALKAPEIEQYRTEYVAPENELEERICNAMQEILFHDASLALSEQSERFGERVPVGRERGFGVNDDFYLLGGDSLRTIELVTNLGIEDLTVTDIYSARTPRAIAERWMKKMID